MKICPICGKEFEEKYYWGGYHQKTKKYCSSDCSREVNKQKALARYYRLKAEKEKAPGKG